MSNIYLGYHFTIEPKELGSEILIAELGEKAFESFTETETGIDAFVQKELWDETILDGIFILQSDEFTINYTFEEIEQINYHLFSLYLITYYLLILLKLNFLKMAFFPFQDQTETSLLNQLAENLKGNDKKGCISWKSNTYQKHPSKQKPL